ncbi:outer membrane beta-barrel protein [Pleurocapsales cyanobacterium LEGE 10410]|nr:outer membrane beta-barrel protein [Pleurocapsales cyanobacterium LEGE 10410]
MIKTTVLAGLLALALPYGARAESVNVEKYNKYQVSCSEAGACNDFKVTFEESDRIAQTRRTRTRRTRSSNRLFEDYYVGGSAGLLFGDDLNLGFQGSIFGGTWYNEYIGGDLEFTFGFAGLDNIDDESATILGFFLNPRFQYQFDNSQITAFVSPGIGLGYADALDDSDTDFAFQIKAGASYPVRENLDAFIQGRFQTTSQFDPFTIELGAVYDISR